MDIAFPIENDCGMESRVYNHFGTAPFFMIIKSDDNRGEIIVNKEIEHLAGKCQPLSALQGKKVDAVVAGGIGAGALKKLRENRIKVYQGVEGTVNENLELIKSGKLPEFPAVHVCQGDCSHKK